MEPRVLATFQLSGRRIEAVAADMTRLEVEALVNAANSDLAHGGGLAGALVAAGGESIQEESDLVAPVSVGGAAATSAGSLPARWIIHAVGPRWGQGDEEALLRSAVTASLELAAELGARSIAIPAISTGIFGYPKDEGTWVIVDEVLRWIAADAAGRPEMVCFTASDDHTAALFAAALEARRDAAGPD